MNHFQKFFLLFVSLTFSIIPCVDVPFHPEHFFLEEVLTGKFENPRPSGYVSDLYTEQNLKDWEVYFGKKVSREELRLWLYETELVDLEKLSSQPIARVNNSLTENFWNYLLFAKANEAFTYTPNVEVWELGLKNPSQNQLDSQIKKGEKLFQSSKDKFLRERYIFQIVRLYFFQSEYQQAIDFYNKHSKEFGSTQYMKWRTLGYVAGSQFHLKNYSEANYLYAKMYLSAPIQQLVALTSFHPQNESDWQKSLDLAKAKEEKLVLWYLFGLKFDRVYALENIQKIDPSSNYMNHLLSIAIREVSYPSFERDYNQNTDAKKKINQMKDKYLLSVVKNIADSDFRKKDFAWKIASAYLNYIAFDFAAGDTYLKEAEKLQKSKLQIKQFHLTSVLGKILRIEKLDSKNELDLLEHLTYLYSDDSEVGRDERLVFPKDWIRGVIGELLAERGDRFFSEWVRPGIQPKFYTKIENIQGLADLLQSNKLSDFEKIMKKASIHSPSELFLLLGSRYAMEDQLEKAAEIFAKLPKEYYKQKSLVFQNQPFQTEIFDRYLLSYEQNAKQYYNHASFLEALLNKKLKAESSPDNQAALYHELGNAFYNMSYFGTSGFSANAIYGIRTYPGWGYLDVNRDPTEFPELRMENAKKYYLLAREKSQDPEFRAKMTFLASKTEHANWLLLPDSERQGRDFQPGVFFKELKDSYSQTKYYSEILKECTYFQKYAGK
jgi:hypothetical protein